MKVLAHNKRKGTVVVLSAVLLVVVMLVLALSIDLGCILVARTQAQRSADAAAMAAAWELATEGRVRDDVEQEYYRAVRGKAALYAAANSVMGVAPKLDANQANALDGDIVLGRIEDPAAPQEMLTIATANRFNAVRVRVRRDAERNGPVGLFFARALGTDTADVMAEATAMFADQVVGFRPPEEGNSTLLPFVVHESTWQNWLDGAGDDNWGYYEETGTVFRGGDDVREFTLFAGGNASGTSGDNGALTSGNFGTVNLGNSGNSAGGLQRQILNGPSVSDFTHYSGSEIRLGGTSNTLTLNGDTGITASIANALMQVTGQPRTIMLYREVSGSGENAMFTITAFIGVRIVRVEMNGSNSVIRVQPALVLDSGSIADTGGGTPSWFVGPSVSLVR